MSDPRINDAYELIQTGNSDQAISLLREVTESSLDVQDSFGVVVAHFLLGFMASKTYWRAEKSVIGTQPGSLRPYPTEVQEQVIRHFTAFLEHTERDRCLVRDDYGLRLNVGISEEPDEGPIQWIHPTDSSYYARWAAFPDFGRSTVSKRDDISLALDRRALAFHLSNRPLEAARDLQAALERSDWTQVRVERQRIVNEYYPVSFGTPQNANLQGWIGWLLFDGGEFAEAAKYLEACHQFMQPDDVMAEEEGISKEWAKLMTWFDFTHASRVTGSVRSTGVTILLWPSK